MKKFTLFIAALFVTGAVNAQDMTSKRGVNILPEAGDISITISANPFLDYVGGFMNGNSEGDQAQFTFFNEQQYIQGRYFLSETKAVRGGLRIGFASYTDKALIPALNGGTGTTEVKAKASSFDVVLNGGLEFRRGKYGRFQGYYGGELLFGIMSSENNTSIDPAFDADNLGSNGVVRGKVTYEYAGTANGATTQSILTYESKPASTLMFGLQGFIGVEYFFAPKVSVSGEYAWGFMFKSTGEGTNDNGVGSPTSETKIAGNSNLMLDTSNSGSLKLNFIF